MKTNLRGVALRVGAIAAIVTAGAATGAGPAHASGGGEAKVFGNQIHYIATGNDDNNVEVTAEGGFYWIDDDVKIDPGPGCQYMPGHDSSIVRCAGAASDGTPIGLIHIYTGAGDDTVSARVHTVWIRMSLLGGVGNDTLHGQNGPDIIEGGSGDDSLFGFGGNDELYAGNQNGGGSEGDNTLDGGADDDALFGGAGRDVLEGQHGRDHLFGGGGNDTIRGGVGNDTLLGSNGNDTLEGGDGEDTLDGGAHRNTLDGGLNRDTCRNGPTFTNCEAIG